MPNKRLAPKKKKRIKAGRGGKKQTTRDPPNTGTEWVFHEARPPFHQESACIQKGRKTHAAQMNLACFTNASDQHYFTHLS